MLGFFPNPYPNELLYSVCARFQERLYYPSQISVVRDLFQTKNAIATVDLLSKLNRFVAALPTGHSYTVDDFIDNHTLLPFYRPFLPLERLQLVRQDMCGDNGSKIHTRLGIVAGFIEMPSHLRFCPLCMEDDQKQFGECYWHRLHQLPGVEVCSTHGVFLEKSAVLTHNRRRISEFISLEQATQLVSLRPVDSLNPGHKVLLKIATDIGWLLNNCRFVPSLEALYQKYLSLVKTNPELVTYTGRIRVQELLRLFKNYYPSQVLDWLQCPLDEQIRDNWLAQLVRFPKRVHHPLRHLPPPLTNNGTLDVDWDNRDVKTVEAVKVAAQRLKQDVNRPIWISRTAIANFLDHPASAWVKRHLNRLPITAKVLDELAETREEFAVRRVQWAANTFHQENIIPQKWQLVRRASLRKETRKLPLVKEAIAAALEVLNSLI